MDTVLWLIYFVIFLLLCVVLSLWDKKQNQCIVSVKYLIFVCAGNAKPRTQASTSDPEAGGKEADHEDVNGKHGQMPAATPQAPETLGLPLTM